MELSGRHLETLSSDKDLGVSDIEEVVKTMGGDKIAEEERRGAEWTGGEKRGREGERRPKEEPEKLIEGNLKGVGDGRRKAGQVRWRGGS